MRGLRYEKSIRWLWFMSLSMTLPSVGYFVLIPRAARPSEPGDITQGPEPCGPHLGLERRAFRVSYNE